MLPLRKRGEKRSREKQREKEESAICLVGRMNEISIFVEKIEEEEGDEVFAIVIIIK